MDSATGTLAPLVLLADAVRANDTGRAAELLASHPEIASQLNDPMPGGAFGEPMLMPAVQWQNREMIDLLIRNGADINQRSQWWAGSFGVLDSCEPGFASFLIERGATVDAHAAARLGMLERLETLVSDNPELVHGRGGDGQTPLHFASGVEIAQYLLNHGADINARDVDHESTPAQYMVRDRQEVARFLVSRGGATDILMAAALGDIARVRAYLDDDPASIRTRVSAEYFPMRDPRAGGTIYNWTLGGDKTPHLVAREFGHEDIFSILMERSSDELKLAQACELGDKETFEVLLARRPDLAQTLSEDERHKLVEAAENNNTEAVRLMLSAGWPTDLRGNYGGTALHVAAWFGNADMVRELLRHGATVDVRGDQFNLTPLGWALHGSENSWRKDTGDYAATVELLLDAGAVAAEVVDGLQASEPVRNVLRRYADQKR
jgi:ankyrin repeat protein